MRERREAMRKRSCALRARGMRILMFPRRCTTAEFFGPPGVEWQEGHVPPSWHGISKHPRSSDALPSVVRSRTVLSSSPVLKKKNYGKNEETVPATVQVELHPAEFWGYAIFTAAQMMRTSHAPTRSRGEAALSMCAAAGASTVQAERRYSGYRKGERQ